MRVIIGITGASGAVYGLELLRQLKSHGHETHAVISDYGQKVLAHECAAGAADIESLAHRVYDNDDLTAAIASGSFRGDAMVIAPCTMRTLAAVASGLADNLICRAADVMLKERKNLVLVVRETPLNAVHLENMLKLSRMGAGIMPACPGFYHRPSSISDLVALMVGRIMDSLDAQNSLFPRWQGIDRNDSTQSDK